MATIEAFAPAKINLTLHVTGRREDGFHLLDSLVVFADLGDRLWLRPARQAGLSVTGPMAAGVPADARNLALRAARLIGAAVDIRLEKTLPAAAGIGGGSSDAAAVLRALRQMGHALPDRLEDLGADVPVCLLARAARMSGIGEVVEPVEGLPALPAVLVNPRVAVSTPDVFRRLERRDNAPMGPIPQNGDRTAFIDWLAAQRNDLQPAAESVAPVIGGVLRGLEAEGALLARMSGSGATCFGLFDTPEAARAAAGRLSAARPGWWVAPTVLNSA
ncbi:4-(cytidine 5'-diphospho)-2-C-methyl-D-erythritol kinase [Jhaorihella thermophila]|uniref:4-diphosphocytidyl-2-C-methyl-D-erythritol kinase n=1 Tax=Jhaorihella thermophila TaxID=488547 RepID=A0A1H5W9U1_9RHOB|nr:4-(cytidine 5'-diphospho)-2-C-methyl-D-erythritol kinase [Jhaorihella thermophila]SEF96205.1 4-diphosphocytidyl-2-C-methyl-D-erythritol kinase [Jhaorihella thermophila]